MVSKLYNKNLEFQVKEVEFLKKNNKVDHIKKMNSLLSFKTKGSTYSETHGNLFHNYRL